MRRWPFALFVLDAIIAKTAGEISAAVVNCRPGNRAVGNNRSDRAGHRNRNSCRCGKAA